MARLADIPIRWKLVLITAFTSAIALAFAVAIIAVYDGGVYQAQKSRDVAVTADILAASVAASVSFADTDAAQEYLDALKANPEIDSAGVYGTDGKLFASYVRAGAATPPPSAPSEGVRFTGRAVIVSAPVIESKSKIGSVYLRATAELTAERLARYAAIMLLVGIAALAVGVPIALRLHSGIADPVRQMSAAATRIAAGDLDVDVEISGRSDELGTLIAAFNEMVRSLREMTAEVGSGAQVLAETASDIFSTTTQVAAGSAETAAAISETSVTMEELRQTVQMSVEKARIVSDGAQHTSQVAQSGRKAVEDVAAGMARIREQVEAVAGSILRLSEQSQAIGEIIAAVNDLADQSNLLAVNAAIEAARAGEQGRGFAVVAQEVKNLSEQSKQATAQVRSILGEIQKATTAAVLATEQGTKAVDEGVRQSAQAGEAIRVLANSIDTAAQAAVQIAASSQQQLAGVSQVAAAMDSIRQASAQNADGVRHVEAAAKNVNAFGQKLQTLVQKYKT